MTTSLALGTSALSLAVKGLYRDASWTGILRRKDGLPWADDLAAWLIFTNRADGSELATWNATVAGTDITFTATALQVNTVLAPAKYPLAGLWYSQGGQTRPWALGDAQ